MRWLFHRRAGHRDLLGGATALALVGLVAVACEHSQQVQKVAEEAKRHAKSGNGNAASGSGGTTGSGSNSGSTSGTTGGIPSPTGPVPDELMTSEVDLGEDTFTGDPIVDEGNRASCGDTPIAPAYVPDPTIRSEAQALVAQMDINQKVLQLTGVEPDYNNGNRWDDIQRSRDDAALGLRGFLWRDGPHGLNLEAGVVLETGINRDNLENYTTSFPTSVAQGASFDVDLNYRVGEAMGDETLASGNDVLLAPCMNVLRHPYWGRAQETFGEDTFHLGRIATALTRGLQQRISGCAKHFTANNIENQRALINSDMDEQTLREVYGRHFEMVVHDGGVGCIMASYNKVQGTKSTQNHHTLTEMLRDDMGFEGFVLTDWWAMPGDQGPVNAPQDGTNAAEALAAGLDVEVPWTVNFDAIPSLVADGKLDVGLVNRSVEYVLEQKLRFNVLYSGEPMGLKPPTTTYDPTSGSIRNNEAHVALAEEAAEKAMVLLKNDAGALPITGATTVAVVGPKIPYSIPTDNPSNKVFDFAEQAALGDRGSSRVSTDPAETVGPRAGIAMAGEPLGVTVTTGSTAAEAADADVAVVVVGLTPQDEGEEYTGAADRENLSLGDTNNALVTDVVAARGGKPTIVVIEAGSAVTVPWLDQVDAVVMAWYPGMQGGVALGRLLFGTGGANFAGRLPITWPKDEAQLPVFSEGDSTFMDYYVGYKRFEHLEQTYPGQYQPEFAFGHGLSYSTFRYERLHVGCVDASEQAVIPVEVDVRNVEGPAGDEVIFVFASYPEAESKGIRRPLKELKGFARVHLEAGQGKRVTIPIRVQDLKYWDTPQNSWAVEQGPVLLQVGPSSDSPVLEQLRQTVTIN